MTIWLMLKGIIDNDFSFAKAFVDFGLPTDKFGNTVPLPAIPVISSLLLCYPSCLPVSVSTSHNPISPIGRRIFGRGTASAFQKSWDIYLSSCAAFFLE